MAAPLKLSFSQRMSNTNDDVDVNPSTNSAQLAMAEREIKKLKQENDILKKNYDEINSLYAQLIAESDHENYDKWRTMLLKSQIIQLERQMMLLTDAAGRRSAVIMDVENALAAAADLCRSVLMQNEKTSVVKMSHSDFERLIQTIESSRKKMFRTTEATSVDNVKRPLHTWNHFVRSGRPQEETVSLIDICTGCTDHVNLKHVSQLETHLMALYQQLKLVTNSLSVFGSSSDVPKALHERLAGQVAMACNMLKETNQQLLQLSVLIPSAPMPTVNGSVVKELNSDDIVRAFQKACRGQNKQKDSRHLVDALLKAMNYSVFMAGAGKELLENELKFHRTVYDLHSDHVASFLASIKGEYFRFESDLQTMICKPLKEILASFESLKKTTNDRSLQIFVKVFKDHAELLSETVDRFSSSTGSTSTDASEKEKVLSEYGRHFSKRLGVARFKCKQERDRRIDEMESVRTELEDYLLELRKLFPGAGPISTEKNIPSVCDDHSTHDAQENEHLEQSLLCPERNFNPTDNGRRQKQDKLARKSGNTKSKSIANLEGDAREDARPFVSDLSKESQFTCGRESNHLLKDYRCTCGADPEQATDNCESSLSTDSKLLDRVGTSLSDGMDRKKLTPTRKKTVMAVSKLRLKKPFY